MSALSDIQIADGAIAQWLFNETSGTTLADSVGTADGASSGSPTLNQTSLIYGGDASILFDGSDDECDIASPAAIGVSTVAFETVIQPEYIGFTGSLEYLFDGNPSRFYLAWKRNHPSTITLYDGSSFHEFGNTPSDGSIYHVMLLLNGTSAKLCLNGSQFGSTKTIAAINWASITDLGLMGGYSGGSRFKGYAECVAFYDVALTASDALAHYETTQVPTGISTAQIQNTIFTSGSAQAAIQNTVYATGVASAAIRNTVYALGSSLAAIKNWIFATGNSSAAIRNDLTHTTGVSSVQIQNSIFATGTSSVQIENRINDPVLGKTWQCQVTLGGVDMTARLSGEIRVEAEESAARTAEFSLLPFSGAIDPYDWIGQSVAVDYALYDASGALVAAYRLFTGYVEEPVYDPVTGFTEYMCTDGLQTSTEALSRAQIDTQIGGYYSDHVFGETDDLWQYAQDRMSTQPKAYDKDARGAARLTDWAAKASADFAFTEANIVHQSLGLSLIRRRDLLNAVDLDVGYRYGRKWHREVKGGWHYPRPFIQYLADSTTLPNRDMVLSAMDTGWLIKSINWTKLPANGQYVLPEGSQTYWYLSDELRNYLIWGVGFTAALKWLQDVTESYDVRVQSAASIAQHGEIDQAVSYAVDLDIDEDYEVEAAERGLALTSTGDAAETGASFGYTDPVGGIQINSKDWIIDPADRSEYEAAMLAGIAKARADILKSHRRNRVVLHDLLQPEIDLVHTASVTTTRITAKGKVRRVLHTLNTDTGQAISEIELALYLPNVAGQADDALALPSNADTTPAATPGEIALGSHFGGRTTTKYDESWNGYIGNWQTRTFPSEWYPEEFRIDFPEVETAARDAAEFTASTTINVAIPQDTLTISA